VAVKNIVDEGLKTEEIIIIVSLDIQTAFNAAWWSNILRTLQDCGCPRILHYLIKSYLRKDMLYCQPTA
jgi:hypothetical protein